jgi:hypothetical protein
MYPAGTFNGNTIAAVLENSNAANPTTLGPLNTVLSALATTYTLDQSLGIVNTGPGGTNAAGSMDIFNGQLNVPTGTALTGANLAALGSTSAIGQDVATLSHILDPQGLAPYKPVSETDSLVTGKTFSSDWGLSAQLVVPTAQQIANGFSVGDHSILKFNAHAAVVGVPEPSTCALLLLGSVGFSLITRRRNRKANA